MAAAARSVFAYVSTIAWYCLIAPSRSPSTTAVLRAASIIVAAVFCAVTSDAPTATMANIEKIDRVIMLHPPWPALYGGVVP
ncbi:MAG: hypothetical protein HYU37_01090 [Acidobacteria bacterium]|nr:hypothetical protein [Acidobacteriota bacterium]